MHLGLNVGLKKVGLKHAVLLMLAAALPGAQAAHAAAQATPTVVYQPYIQPGDAGPLGASDQMVVAWQTDEAAPSASAYTVSFGKDGSYGLSAAPAGRTVDNYLAADPQFGALALPNPTGAHSNYYAVLKGLDFDTVYSYKVSGPGLPPGGFVGTFRTRKTGSRFSFQVQGDEGFYPGIPGQAPLIVDYQARIIHTMYHVADLSQAGAIAGLPAGVTLPRPDLALNTGDNVYTTASDGNYRDVWFRDWNSDADTNDSGSPFIRAIPYYIVIGNHDIGGSGASANLLADNPPTTPGQGGPGPYGGGLGGGDALAHFNNFYDPLNGPAGVDIQSVFNGDDAALTGLYFTYQNKTYTSPAAIKALRDSTLVDSGADPKRQIDHESNYSFDAGNAHFVFLDANPHLFNSLLPGGSNYGAPPSFPFPEYPSVLRSWLINDLDNSAQPWKIVVYHQPAFSSGNGTLRNDQMRRVAKLLEDHGVNLVFNGHEHNYQRTRPLRALPPVTASPAAPAPPAVAIDTAFDGAAATVPDGVIHLVEGAGGNRDFDNNEQGPRGSGLGVDQDDAATGAYTPPGTTLSLPNGPASWLDTNLTNSSMTPFFPAAGSGPKITVKFKAKVFSFADVVVRDNALTLYQISEPLGASSSATPAVPAPFGTDAAGKPVPDALPDTVLDGSTGKIVSGTGSAAPAHALLDQFTVTKPDLAGTLAATLSAPPNVLRNGPLVYSVALTNRSPYGLNGVQAVFALPDGAVYTGPTGDTLTQNGQGIVVTLGRLEPGATRVLQFKARVTAALGSVLSGAVTVRSGTALPVVSNTVRSRVVSLPPPPAR